MNDVFTRIFIDAYNYDFISVDYMKESIRIIIDWIDIIERDI